MKQETKLAIITVILVLFVSYYALPPLLKASSNLVLNAIDHELDKNDETAVRHNRR